MCHSVRRSECLESENHQYKLNTACSGTSMTRESVRFYDRADWQWTSEYHTSTNLDPRNIQSTYSLVNLRLGLGLDDGLDASLFANNAFNRTSCDRGRYGGYHR